MLVGGKLYFVVSGCIDQGNGGIEQPAFQVADKSVRAFLDR